MAHAKDCKCSRCDKQAVAFYPCIDPDIPSYPYCADHLYDAMVEVAKAVWKDDKGMQAIAIYQAEQTRDKYKKELEDGNDDQRTKQEVSP